MDEPLEMRWERQECYLPVPDAEAERLGFVSSSQQVPKGTRPLEPGPPTHLQPCLLPPGVHGPKMVK